MDTETVNGEMIDQAIAGLAELSGLPVSDVTERCRARTGGSPDPLVWASAVEEVATGLGYQRPDMISEYTSQFTPESYLERERQARAAQVALTSPEDYGLTEDGRLLPTPEEISSEILRLYSAHGSRSGIDPLKASSAAAAASPVQLTQTSRSKYGDSDEGYEDTLSLSATYDSGTSQTDEDKILALTRNARYTAYFGDGSPGAPRGALKINARGDQPGSYRATVQAESRHPSESPEAIIERAKHSRATAAMFGLTRLPSYEHDVTEPDYGDDDDTDAAATVAKIMASHPDYFGREAPTRSGNVVTRPLSPDEREAAEQAARPGHTGRGQATIPQLASGTWHD